MAFGLLALIAINLGLFVAQRLLFRPPKNRGADWTHPTSEEGRTVPVLWGTAEMAPNTVWCGNLFKKKEGSIFRYYASMHHIFCFGLVNEVVDYSFDGKSCRNHHLTHPWEGLPSDPVMEDALNPVAMALDPLLPIEIDLHGDQQRKENASPAMFGGNQQGGGIAGNIAFYFGSDSQPEDAFLAAGVSGVNAAAYGDAEVSNWPRIAYARMGGPTDAAGFYQGTSATAYPFRAVLRRTHWWEGSTSPLGQTNAEATIRADANPAEILYDLHTNPYYGMGIPDTLLDMPSFEAAAVTLRDEFISPTIQGFGLSVLLTTPTKAETVIRSILDHIDASLAKDPVTGLVRLKLIRADYDPDTILVIDKMNSRDLSYTPSEWRTTVNTVHVTYNRFINTTQRRGMEPGIATTQGSANFQDTGSERTATIDMPYISDPDVAQLVAERERRMRGVPLRKAKWKMTRAGYRLMQGDAVKVNWPLLGIDSMIVRITSVDYGTFADSLITIEGVEDIFSVTQPIQVTPAESGFAEQEVPVPPPVDDELFVDWGFEAYL